MVSLATDNGPTGDDAASDDGMGRDQGSQQETADIYQRMEYLSYAIHSGSVAVANPVHDCSTSTAVLTIELVDTMVDQLTVASKSRFFAACLSRW